MLVNRAAERLFGVDRHAVVGKQFTDAFSLTDNDGRTWVEHNLPFEGPRTRTGVPEQSWVLPDGNECLVTARIRRDLPLGPPTGVAMSVRSGRGRARLDRERSDLVAAVAHELRSPLTGVKGFVQAMLSRWTRLNDEQKLLMLTTVHADADRLSRLITELLDVARLDTGRLSLARRGADVRVLLERIITNVQGRRAARHRAGRARPTCPRSTSTPTSSPRSSPTSSRTPSATAAAPCGSRPSPGSTRAGPPTASA